MAGPGTPWSSLPAASPDRILLKAREGRRPRAGRGGDGGGARPWASLPAGHLPVPPPAAVSRFPPVARLHSACGAFSASLERHLGRGIRGRRGLWSAAVEGGRRGWHCFPLRGGSPFAFGVGLGGKPSCAPTLAASPGCFVWDTVARGAWSRGRPGDPGPVASSFWFYTPLNFPGGTKCSQGSLCCKALLPQR